MEDIGVEQIEVLMNDDENKFITDFKSMIMDRKEPFSIKILKFLGVIMFLMMLSIGIARVILFDQRKDQVLEGFNSILLTSKVIGGVAQVNYYARKMQLESTKDSSNFNQWQSNLTSLVTLLQSNQFDLVKLQIKAASRGVLTDINSTRWGVSPNGTAFSRTQSLDISVFDYITSASALQSLSPSAINFTLSKGDVVNATNAYINFYNVIYTGVYSILNNETTNLNNMYTFYRYFIN